MDTFFEQIVEIRKTGLDWLKLAGIWLLAGVLLFVFFLLGVNFPGVMSILALLCIGVIYGAFWLSKRLSVEYEYIVTNGTLDVDKIIARSSRKRELSCELSCVERVEKYNPAAPVVGNFKKQVIACNPTDPEAYLWSSTRRARVAVCSYLLPMSEFAARWSNPCRNSLQTAHLNKILKGRLSVPFCLERSA